MRVLVSAGDSSGDQILAEVIKEVRQFPGGDKIEFVGLAGPKCEALGVKIVARPAEVAVVGLVEVLGSLKKLFSVLGRLSQEMRSCDALLCVDFPDFNFRLAKVAKRLGVPVDYLVAPQAWVWRQNRRFEMREFVRRLYVVLPFEQSFFSEAGIDAHFLGHPIRDVLPVKRRREVRESWSLGLDDFVLSILPGSRQGEIKNHFPLMVESLRLIQKRKDYLLKQRSWSHWRVLVSCAPGFGKENLIHGLSQHDVDFVNGLEESGKLRFVVGAHEALMASDFSWVVSGTASLEAGLYQTPHILLYRLNWLSALILRMMTGYFSKPDARVGLPNILLERDVIPELLQHELSPKRLATETLELLGNPTRLSALTKTLRFLPKRLGDVGASKRVAVDLLSLWKV